MKLLGSTKSKLSKYENSEDVTEVVLVHCILATTINTIQELCIHLFLINDLINY